jgi:hypothetical protein
MMKASQTINLLHRFVILLSFMLPGFRPIIRLCKHPHGPTNGQAYTAPAVALLYIPFCLSVNRLYPRLASGYFRGAALSHAVNGAEHIHAQHPRARLSLPVSAESWQSLSGSISPELPAGPIDPDKAEKSTTYVTPYLDFPQFSKEDLFNHPRSRVLVIPAKAGIQHIAASCALALDPRFREGDIDSVFFSEMTIPGAEFAI